MSSIVVVEPYRILQQALVLALPLEHKIRMTAVIPGQAELARADAVIVDAAALQDKAMLTAREMRTIATWPIPIVWIERGGSPQPPRREGMAIVQNPLRPEDLAAALSQCLDSTTADKPREAPAPGALKRDRKARQSRAAANAPAEPTIIELVDVVEEAAEENFSPEN